ncbi:MAG: spore germination protein [Caloramator sp.]|nr:spore germination protein [Caloramator sp.]
MTPNDDKISSYQLGVIIFNTILGIGILFLPTSLTKVAENDGWILLIISGIISIFFAYLMCYVGKKYSKYGLVGTLRILFGNITGTLLTLPLVIYFIYFSAIEVRLFAETAKLYLLPLTPLEFIIIPIILLTVALARNGIETIARFFEITMIFVSILIFVLIIVTIPNSDYSNIRPFLGTPLVKLIKGINASVFSYAGFEILLVIFPFLRTPNKAFKSSTIGLFLIIMCYVIVEIQCLAKFGVKETQTFIYPTISLIRASQVPGGVIERLEGLLLALWVTSVYTTIVSFCFSISVICADLFNQKKQKHFVSLIIPIIYIFSLFGDSVVELFDLSNLISNTLGLYTMGILPLLMFIFSRFKRDVNKGEG